MDVFMSLRKVFDTHSGRLIGKIDHFFDNYECHFRDYQRTPVKLLEIGVHGGGSLELWRRYFGDDAEIHGIDIDAKAAESAPDDCHIHIGSQSDASFLLPILETYGPFDIVIDDGSHLMSDQIRSFELIYPTMAKTGIYVCEDAFTSYWPEYGGALKQPGTFMEYAKDMIDELHAYWIMDSTMPVSPFTQMTNGIQFYSGAVVFQRAEVAKPRYIVKNANQTTVLEIEQLKLAAARTTGQ